MEKALWYLFAGTRGGANRVRIVRRLDDRPYNANELADQLDVDYNTVTHHLDMLEEHDVVEPGAPVADITTPHGDVISTVAAERYGYILGRRHGVAVYENDVLVSMAARDDGDLLVERS
jgi:DNA-binding transcriptional ArsR family regulator